MRDELRKAAQAVLDRWDSPKWEWISHGPTADLMTALRAALAAAQPPAAMPVPLQAGMDNAALTDAWCKKLPGVVPTERDLTAFALGAEVGFAHARDLDRQDWDRVHHALARHGKHPGRTDAHLADVIDRALAAAPTPQAQSVPATGAQPEPTRADLVAALAFYADGQHFDKCSPDAWDTVSGEPQNWWCDEAGTATVEDGSIAKMTLAGELTAAQIEAIEDDEEFGPSPTAPTGSAG